MAEIPPIKIQISDDARKILAGMKDVPLRMARAMCRALDRENQLTIGHIQETKLSERGPKTLGVVTNRLRSSVRATAAEVIGDGVTSSIGTNVIYAGPHEFGFDGEVTVKEHMRKTATRFAIDNGRTTVSRKAAGRLGLLTKKGTGRKGAAAAVGGQTVTVKQHMRKMHLPARGMFQAGITERATDYAQALSQAVLSSLRVEG